MRGTADHHDHPHGRTIMMPTSTQARLWSVQDVSDYLGVPVMTLYHWRRSGAGPRCAKIGRHLRYRVEDVESWLDEQTRKAG
jgi:excisionase family DNA binding protein